MNILRCKVALIGDPKVGKTSMINQLVRQTFNNTYQTTLGIEYNIHEAKIKDTNYTVQFHILDFTGFSIFRDLLGNQIKDANIILYVYDSTNLESFQSIKLWKESVKELTSNKKFVEYLVGNKCEVESKIAVNETSVSSYESLYNLKSWSVSALTNTNIAELFENLSAGFYGMYNEFLAKMSRV